ncbi:MAG: AAA family ATPase [Rhodobacteraceae bacterium]|nr:AAA family ATPase [Paracoccaceae bacterium]
MADPLFPTDSKAALYTVCFFLAQSGEPHTDLGYETQTAAFDAVGAKFGVPRNTVKNERDAFDKFTDSDRSGWNKELAPRLKPTFDIYASTSREDLRELSLAIMSSNWEKLDKEADGEMDGKSGSVGTGSSAPAPQILPDLKECQRLSKERAAKIKIDQLYAPSPEVWKQILSLYRAEMATDNAIVVGTSSMTIETDKGKVLTISSQEFPRCWAVRPYVVGILLYEEKVNELAKELGFATRSSGRGKEEIFKRLPASNAPKPKGGAKLEVAPADMANIIDAVENKLNLDKESQARFIEFLTDGEWGGISKTLERTDWTTSAIVGVGGWLANASTRRGELSIALAKSDAFEELTLISGSNGQSPTPHASAVSLAALKGGENVIFYGAPGTGKSDRVEKKIKAAGKRPFRTVFHPDLQNSDFFGCLKPQMDGKKVRYGFSPGPFMKALAEAYKEPAEPVFLVIEELNRAAAAAVFGDLFLLLDRDEDGRGEYDVSFPSPESEQWFEKETGAPYKALQLPSNLSIYATMNSADQGVYPIDTAFRRRWRQEYLPLDYKSGPDGDVAYVDATGKTHSLAWREFVKLLNGHLTSSQTMEIAEDRLLGQWFVKKNELDGNRIPEKVLLYLWDDLLRHEGRDLIFDTSRIKTYGSLALETEKTGRILSDAFLAVLNAASEIETAQPEESAEDEN